jgi:hypothetical protein
MDVDSPSHMEILIMVINDLGFVPSPYHGKYHGIINKGDVIGYTNNKLTWMCLKMGYNRRFMAT